MRSMLGTEAAALFPSGTMAQQIALRIPCERRGLDTVAYHPTCHLEIHEHGGYAHLHGLKAELVGQRDRPLTLEDLEGVRARIGALLIELPQREIGGRLPEWDELGRQVQWARDRGAAVHLDGARIWESAPYYGRPHAEIAGLFDTVYVSLYKGLGGFAGSVLAGPADVISEARVWRHRHGGTLSNLFPFAATALRRTGPARRPDAALSGARVISLRRCRPCRASPSFPTRPRRRSFTFISWDSATSSGSGRSISRRRGVWLFNALEPSVVPDVSRAELNIGAPALEVSAVEAAQLFAQLTAA